jgi:hypothetical protein
MKKSNNLCGDVFDPAYAALHNFAMDYDIPKLLKKMMDALPGNQSTLAKRLGGGISQPNVSRWIEGAEPKGRNYERIITLAHELGLIGDVRSEDVSATIDPKPRRGVKLKGYVGAGAEAHFYKLADEDYTEVEAPAGATDQTIAVEIKGSSFGPLLDTWLVFYDDVRSPVTPDLIGEICVVGLEDDRILIKKIQRNGRGGYRLISNASEPPIENALIEWAAKVKDMRPRR